MRDDIAYYRILAFLLVAAVAAEDHDHCRGGETAGVGGHCVCPIGSDCSAPPFHNDTILLSLVLVCVFMLGFAYVNVYYTRKLIHAILTRGPSLSKAEATLLFSVLHPPK